MGRHFLQRSPIDDVAEFATLWLRPLSLADERVGTRFAARQCMTADGERPLRLMDRVRQAIRVRRYSRRTEEAYAGWICRYLAYHRMRHPLNLDATHVSEFLSSLATRGHVSASTQDQALTCIGCDACSH